MRSHLAASSVLVLLVVLSACGSSSSSSTPSSSPSPASTTAAFKTEYSAVANQLKAISMAIGGAIQHAGSQTDAQLASSFHQLASRWQDQVSKLQTLKAPANVAVNFNSVTGAASRVEADLNAIVSAAETHSKSGAEQAAASLVTDIVAAKTASTAITNKLASK